MRGQLARLRSKGFLLVLIPAIVLSYPLLTIVVPAVVRAVVPEVVRSVLHLL